MNQHTIATLGSHSALQILKGACDEGFRTLIITLKDRAAFYRNFPFINKVLVIDNYDQFSKIEKQLKKENTIIIPHGSFVAYLGMKQNRKMKVDSFGNKAVLNWEADRKKQREWLETAKIRMPRRFKKGDHIDRPVIVKSFGASGGSGYFLARNQKDFDLKLMLFNKKRFIVQEYVIGVPIYIHYFYSPLNNKLEILSVDRRYETNVDSLGRLPFRYQSGVDIDPSYVVVGNQMLTLRESLLPEAYRMGERVVRASQKLINKQGLYGPFCLETIVTPDQKFYTIEISCRIVAGTNLFLHGSPYSWLLYDEPMSTGKRIAREIKLALKANRLWGSNFMINIRKTLDSYNLKNIHIGTLGGHSALDIALGAKKQKFGTVVVCQKGREKTFTKYYKNLFDEIIVVDKFNKLTNKNISKKLLDLNTIFVQSRYVWVYCNHNKIENSFPVPIFGTRGIVKLEERDTPNNQYYLMKKGGIRYPKIFNNPKEIDRLVIVKASEANRAYERAFFFAIDEQDYWKKSKKLVKEKLITERGLEKAVIEEYIVGTQVNFNFFYSPIEKKLELMGTDSRRQTNIDGLIRLPSEEQLKILSYVKPQYIEVGHQSCTVKESILEKAFELGEKLVKVSRKEFPPGIIGPFALQSAITAGPPKEEIITFDLSLRIPGSPGTSYTPYSNYHFEKPVSVGERISIELRSAIDKNKLINILT